MERAWIGDKPYDTLNDAIKDAKEGDTIMCYAGPRTWPQPTGWFSPQRKGYLMKCCSCGAVHSIDFRINRTYKNRDIIQMRVNSRSCSSDSQGAGTRKKAAGRKALAAGRVSNTF
jgi:hypothetical protein